MAADQRATIASLKERRKRVTELVAAQGGRVIDFVGDNLLAVFAEPLAAFRCACGIQRESGQVNRDLPPDRRMWFRIGLHVAHVFDDGARLYGDGVNVAARLESLASPGTVCLSAELRDSIRFEIEEPLEDLGLQAVKNIPHPVHVYSCRPAQGPSAESSSPQSKPSLAVLPFRDVSERRDCHHIAEGITMDVLTDLVRIPSLLLISESSTLAYRNSDMSAAEIGRALGVRYVLEGSVRDLGSGLRVNAQLTECAGARRIWAERFDRSFEELSSIHDDITGKIATAVDSKLVSGDWAKLLRSSLKNPDALESYYRGWDALSRSNRADIMEAMTHFAETVRLEPDSYVGYGLLAWAGWVLLEHGFGQDSEALLEQIERNYQRAIELGDVTGTAYLVKAGVLLRRGDHDAALKVANIALEERPNCDASFVTKAAILTALERPCEAMDVARYALRLSPVQPPLYLITLARAELRCGFVSQALQSAKAALDREPMNLEAMIVLLAAYTVRGDHEAAEQVFAAILAEHPRDYLIERGSRRPEKEWRLIEERLDGSV